ncbi:MAG: DNA mismatch repair protein MutS [Anaerolineae bacterium]|nr:DNA mismatch repair protein MutS [Anaerolineae bacterium]
MTTPLRQQYLRIKREYPGTILFFRLGDFYETFDDDARIVSEVCDIVLTSRPVGKDQRVPLAGVPHHAVEGYIGRLISAGYKVAIVEQMSEPGAGHLVEREVVRVVTPGTVVEPSLLDARRNNYLVALALQPERGGVAYVDITTGEFATTEVQGEGSAGAIWQEVARLQPAELLVAPELEAQARAWAAERVDGLADRISVVDGWRWEEETARQALLQHFGVASLAAYGCEDLPAAIQSAAAIVQYLEQTQRSALAQLTGLVTYSTSSFMTLDAATRRNLELTEGLRSRSTKGSLLGVLDLTVSPMGARLLRRWIQQPLLRADEITARQEAVAALVGQPACCAAIQKALRQAGDLERLTNRVVQRVATPRDLLALRTALITVPGVVAELERVLEASGAEERDLRGLLSRLDPCGEVSELIGDAIAGDPPASLHETGVIRPGYSTELDAVTRASRDAKQWVADLERTERERTGIKSLKVGYNRVFGYYIEVTRANLSAVPPNYIRKQTLVNGERFITPELKEQEALILHAEERVAELEARLFREVLDRIAAESRRLMGTAQALAHVDVYVALAEVARRYDYCRPIIDDGPVIEIVEGRHPVVERTLPRLSFVPNDTRLSPEEQILIITGPNMSGKSTYLRQVALIVLLAQIGSFVPAKQAHIGIVDRIFTRVGAQDEITAGQSTFMVEMLETALILSQSTRRSLLILDEVGRGTSTYDGLAIAQAVVEYVHNSPRIQAKTLFATHFHELTELEKYLPHVRNYNVAVVEEGDRVTFLHKIVPGGADRSYGIHVAQIAGIPRPVIRRARELLEELERRVKASSERRPVASARSRRVPPAQLPLFSSAEDPLVEELKALRIDEMSPLEALSKLYELQRRARERGSA